MIKSEEFCDYVYVHLRIDCPVNCHYSDENIEKAVSNSDSEHEDKETAEKRAITYQVGYLYQHHTNDIIIFTDIICKTLLIASFEHCKSVFY